MLLLSTLAAVGVAAAARDVLAGLAAGACVGLAATIWRQDVYDRLSDETHVNEREKAPRPEPPQKLWQPTTVSPGNGRTVIGKMAFTQTEWSRLAAALRENGRTVTRALLEDLYRDDRETKMFPSTTKRYQEYVDELARLGWTDENNTLTPAAVQWFSERGMQV